MHVTIITLSLHIYSGLVRGQRLRGLGGGQEADIPGEGHLHGEAARLQEVRHQRRQRPGVQGEGEFMLLKREKCFRPYVPHTCRCIST